MGYDLIPKKKEVDCFCIGAFSWPLLLQETGAGYVLGCGSAKNPGTYVYQTGNVGTPHSNDGYKVTASDAKCMAKVVRGFLSVQKYVNKEWEETPEDVKQREIKTEFYRKPITNQELLKKMEDFADFAEKSGGFSIH